MGFFYGSFAVTLLPVSSTRPTRWPRLVISLLITLTLVVPIAYLASPWVHRQIHISWLTSKNVTHRQRGLAHLVAKIPKDDRLLADALHTLSVDDNANFLQIVDALQAAGCWDRARVSDDAWLRWIMLHAHEPGIEAPAMAAQRLAELQNLANDHRLISLLTELSNHAEPDVRYNALCAAAELFFSAADEPPYHDLIAGRLNDTDPVIAHHARLFAFLVDASEVDPSAGPYGMQDGHAEARYDKPAILALLLSPDAPLRDVGCVLAVRDLEPGDLIRLIPELLSDTTDDARMAGAILVGVTGLHTDLLHQQIDSQTDWVTASVMKLGLWMHSDEMAGEVQPEALLAHGDVPRTTVILAMLHRQDAQALEVLLNPRGETPDDLALLLENYGWWRVLDRYLPEDAPRWQSDTNASEQQLQIDLLRDWYLVNRYRLMNRPAATR